MGEPNILTPASIFLTGLLGGIFSALSGFFGFGISPNSILKETLSLLCSWISEMQFEYSVCQKGLAALGILFAIAGILGIIKISMKEGNFLKGIVIFAVGYAAGFIIVIMI